MQEPYEDFSVSFIEDLDPESPDKGRQSRVREFFLGIALLLAVLGWAGWQWRQQEHLQDLYSQAQQATLQQNWDQVQVLFASAADFKDSNARAADAAKRITERNKQYADAISQASKEQWAAALQAARAVLDIQSNFRDAATLEKQAEQQVYAAALSGTIALRTQADPPGLYYRSQDKWIWLKDSDKDSRVLGFGPRGHVVYLGATGIASTDNEQHPGTPAVAAPTLDQNTVVSAGGWNSHHVMLAAINDAGVNYAPLAFNFEQYDGFIWGDNGVWGLHPQEANPATERYGVRSGYVGYQLDYQAYNSPVTTSVSLPDDNWVVMDLSKDGSHILLADVTGWTWTAPTSKLYIADADGSNRRLLFTYAGGIQSASLSQDSRYAMVSTYSPLSNYRDEKEAIFIVKADGSASPTKLAERAVNLDNALETGSFPTWGSIFLTQGQFAGKAVLGEWGTGNSTFRFADPDKPCCVISTADAKYNPVGSIWIAEQDIGGGPVFTWQNGLGGVIRYADNITAAQLQPDGTLKLMRFSIGDSAALTGAWLRGDRLIYSSQSYDTDSSGKVTYIIRSAQLGSAQNGAATQPNTIYIGKFDTNDVQPFTFSRGWTPGPQMLAYTSADQLHVRTYDGSVDLTLELGVKDFYDFSLYSLFHRMR